jgi:tape measure domain-containing protein
MVVRELVTKLSYLIDNTQLNKYVGSVTAINEATKATGVSTKKVKSDVDEITKAHIEALGINKRIDQQKRKQTAEMNKQHTLAIRMNREFDKRRKAEQREIESIRKKQIMYANMFDAIDRREKQSERQRIASHRRSVNEIRSSMRDIRSLGFGGMMAGLGITAAGTAPIVGGFKALAEYRKTEAGLQALYRGNAVEAKKAFDAFEQLALATPLSTQTVGDLGRSLIAIGKPLDETVETIRRIGDVTFGDNELVGRVGLQYSQAFAKGYADLLDLKPLANANIPIFQALADSMGVSVAEVYKMISRREISIDKLDNALAHLTENSGQYENAMSRMMDEVGGMDLMVKERIQLLLRQIGQDLEPQIKALLIIRRMVIDILRKLPSPIRSMILLFIIGAGALTFLIGAVSRLGAGYILAFFAVQSFIVSINGATGSLTGFIAALNGATVSLGGKGVGDLAPTVAGAGIGKKLLSLLGKLATRLKPLLKIAGKLTLFLTLLSILVYGLKIIKKRLDYFASKKDGIKGMLTYNQKYGESESFKRDMGVLRKAYGSKPSNNNNQNINVKVDATIPVPQGTTKEQETHLRTVANKAIQDIFRREIVQLQANSAGI